MASKVSIANRALTKLGADRILLLTDDSQQARVMNSMFDDVRDAEIRRHHWKFAMRRTTLPALVTAPVWGYPYQYPLPSDFLALVQVNDVYVRACPKGTAPWSVEGGNILTAFAAPLKVRYVARVDNPGVYDPLFVEALACKLAMEACEPLTQSSSKKSAAWEEYKFALSEAKRLDAIENPPDELPWGSWLDSRLGSGEYGSGDAWQAHQSGV
jgi:hypothetical protein